MNAYEQRKLERLERMNARAEKLTEKAETMSDAAWKMNRHIPAGQPILVGHHSERRHRRDLEKQDNAIRKSIEMKERAQAAARAADGASSRAAIDSDDPEAIRKLREQIEELEAKRESIKARPHASYELSNLGANIRRYKKRLEEQIRLAEVIGDESKTCKCGRASFEVDPHEGRVFFHTPERNDEAYKVLRGNGWVWSRHNQCFSRKLTPNAIAAAQRIVGPKLAEIFA